MVYVDTRSNVQPDIMILAKFFCHMNPSLSSQFMCAKVSLKCEISWYSLYQFYELFPSLSQSFSIYFYCPDAEHIED